MSKIRYIIINALLAAMGYALWQVWKNKDSRDVAFEEEDFDDFIGEPKPVIEGMEEEDELMTEEDLDEELPGRGLGGDDWDEEEETDELEGATTDEGDGTDELEGATTDEEDGTDELEEVGTDEEDEADELEEVGTDEEDEAEEDTAEAAGSEDTSESFEESEEVPIMVVDESLPWHIGKYYINEMWKETKGKGVKVAILDSGISHSHPDLECIDSRSFVGNDPHDTEDNTGHGTHCAGIVCAKNSGKVKGIAPDVELFVAKITDADWESDKPPVLKALKWAVELVKADIVLMSFSDVDKNEKLEEYLKDIKSKVLCIGAARNYRYPASYDGCFGIADIGENGEMNARFRIFKSVSLLAPGIKIESAYKETSYETLSGSSMAAAYTVGVCALLKSFANEKKKELSLSDCFQLLIDTATDVDTSLGTKKLIAPYVALQSLKSNITNNT